MRLTQIVEALLFASDAPLTAADLARIDERLDEDTVVAVIDELRAEYDRNERSFTVVEIAGGYQLLTRPEFDVVLDRYQTVPQSAKLSMPALEVLAIVAYRQPLGRAEIEEIRGVQSAAVLRTLQDRHLIEPVARGEGLGRPLLYGTTRKFLDHFGFRSLEDLPRPDELPVVLHPTMDGPTFVSPDDPAEPSPLSDAAETEARALHLKVHGARDETAEAGETPAVTAGSADDAGSAESNARESSGDDASGSIESGTAESSGDDISGIHSRVSDSRGNALPRSGTVESDASGSDASDVGIESTEPETVPRDG